MAMVTITSNSATNISENRNNLRESSFSSYLDSAEENFVMQLAKSSRNLDSFSLVPQNHLHLGRKKIEYGEIDVFSAEKYFNGGVGDQETPKAVHNSSPPDDLLETESLKQKNRPGPGTPSVRSESSWNSRSSLVKIPKNQQPKNGTNSTRGKNFLASLGCKGSCNDKDSIKVHKPCKILDESKHITTPRDGISLPAFNSKPGNAKNSHPQEEKDQEEVTSKISLEVFGSPVMTVDKQIKMLAWDAIPQKEIEIDGTESDASSDLFEIESFSTNTNPYLTRQASNGTCYAPSEVSIEWSTVTASAADFSVMSDFDELKFPDRKNMNGKEMQKRRPSLLSGCKSHKAVSIVGDAYRIRDKTSPDDIQRHHRLESLTPVTRFHATRNGLPLSESSQFKHAPHLLYMH